MGISGGMVRLKGNSPKVSSKDQNRPRGINKYTSGASNVGAVSGGGAQFGMRGMNSSKGMNRPQQNNLMMSQQVMGSSHLGGSQNQGFANSQILNQQQLGIFKSGGPVRATAFEYKMDPF
jgi:hypothetical protein